MCARGGEMERGECLVVVLKAAGIRSRAIP